jgi:two-component system sensor histidine kinase KdpD
MEVLARKPIVYINRILNEFDLDAALQRRPNLILVDEYAHTNIPGSRHPKRWQDVEELLAAGIDVWTTLNVQHLESLNDVVQKITRVRVRETVPDRVFEEADEVVLVDLPPEELLKRLAEGKVYFQETAGRARESFFKAQNLTALRELALRRAAERVDADLIERMQAQAIEGPLPAGERILACVGPNANAAAIVRAAKRLADLMDAPWIAVTVERPGSHAADAQRRQLDAAMKLAEALGADTKTLIGNDISGEILRFARFENVTQIVIGPWRGGYIAERLRRSLAHDLVRRAEGIGIHFVTAGKHDASPAVSRPALGPALKLDPLQFLLASAGVAVALGIAKALNTLISVPNLSLVFILAVLFPAIVFGIWPALFASFLSFLAINFFFIEPLYTFTVAQPHELLALVVFLVVAIISSALAGRVRAQVQLAAQRMRATRRLYEFTRTLSRLATLDAIAEGAATEINSSMGRGTVVLLEEGGELQLRAAWPPVDQLDTGPMTAARWAFTRNEPAGADTATLPTVPWYFLPLQSPRGVAGVVGIAQEAGSPALDPEARALMETLVEQTAAALERASLARDMVAARTATETERMRNTLLASISHDFRTPLASILGSATSLIEYGPKLEPGARHDLLEQIRQEAEGLNGMVRDLLAITRIDAGALELRRDWVDLKEVIERVVASARPRAGTRRLGVHLPADLPLIKADPTLLEQALTNVVGNSISHTPEATNVTIEVTVTPSAVAVSILDDGPGIVPQMLPHIFDKFVRVRHGEGDNGEGTGLGLAIAKGIMQAHGGTITAQSPAQGQRGARIVLNFPRSETPA